MSSASLLNFWAKNLQKLVFFSLYLVPYRKSVKKKKKVLGCKSGVLCGCKIPSHRHRTKSSKWNNGLSQMTNNSLMTSRRNKRSINFIYLLNNTGNVMPICSIWLFLYAEKSSWAWVKLVTLVSTVLNDKTTKFSP